MFYINLVNKRIQIDNRDSYIEHQCRDYLIPHQDGVPHIRIQIPSEVVEQEQAFNSGFSYGYCESICIYREICRMLLPFGILLFHGAIIAYNGQGYAFAGPSGTGKTTHIGLWKQVFGDRVQIINGDKPLLAYDKVQNCFVAYGTPWCGKENWGCNSSVPLRAICFLTQGRENSIQRVEPEEILDRLFQQVLMPEEENLLEFQLDLLDLLIHRVTFYEMTCNISINAVHTAKKAMYHDRWID